MSVQTEFQYGYVLHPKGEMEAMPEPKGADGGFSLEQLQDKVGGLIEVVIPNPHLLGHADFAIKDRVFLANEEGLLQRLAVNLPASGLLGRPIVGPLVVIPEELMK